ncbi:MAG: hypothetical protein LBV41_04940, partial [Cytophagaceae bacterium]|nr:hypothetical protein [Cytophagaceae bacterium]
DSGTDGGWWYNYLYTYRVIYEKGTRDFTYEYRYYFIPGDNNPTRRIFKDFVMPTNLTTRQVAIKYQADPEIPYLYIDLKYFYVSDLVNDIESIHSFYSYALRFRWMFTTLNLSVYDAELVGEPRTEIQDVYEETIDEVLYVVTPYKVIFTVKWGSDCQGEYSYTVEECKVK